jgi:hypothetical protein
MLSGCSLVRQLSPEEYEAIRQNKKTIVLFRLTGSLDNKDVHLLGERLSADYVYMIPLVFGLANLDLGEPVKMFLPLRSDLNFSPSAEAAEKGWGAFILEPGTYYFSITSYVEGIGEKAGPLPEFRFIVPPNMPLVYIGYLHLVCTTKEAQGWFGGREFGSCSSEAMATNEVETASLVAQATLKEFGPPLSAIMQPYSSPLAPGTISILAPVGLLAPASKTELGSPEWMKRAMRIGLLPSAGLVALAGSGPSGPGAGGAVALAILWAPVGTVLGYLSGKWSESSWEPCRKALQESLSKFDPTAELATKLKAALDNWGVSTLEIGMQAGGRAEASEVKSILNAQIQRVVLRFCPTSFLSSTVCLEIVTRVRLFESATQSYLLDGVFVYSNAKPSTLTLQPYELLVKGSETADTTSSTAQSSGRDLEAYCGRRRG